MKSFSAKMDRPVNYKYTYGYMQTEKKNKHRILSRLGISLLIIGAVLIIFTVILRLYEPPRGAITMSPVVSVLHDDMHIKEGLFPVMANGRDRGDFVPGLYRFEFFFDESSFDSIAPVLVFPLIAGNSIAVRLNGDRLGMYGNQVAGNSSIWNTAFFFSLPKESLKLKNRVEVEIRGLSEAGILKQPFIVDAELHSARLFALSFLTVYLPWVFFGIGLVLGLIILAAALLSAPRIDGQFLIGLGCIVTGFLFLDYASIEYLPVTYLLFSKLLVSARHVYFLLFLFTAVVLIKKRISILEYAFSGIQALCVILVCVIPSDVPSLERVYRCTYLTAMPLLPYLLYLFFRDRKKSREFGILLFGAMVAFVTAGLDLFTLTFKQSNPYVSHYGFSILVLCSAIFIVRLMLVQYRELVVEQRRSAMFLDDSTHDALTGAFNRKILANIELSLPVFFSVIFIDLDNFKTINDSLGHAAGDEVLKSLTKIMRNHVRSHDSIVRTGGDEFIAVLPGCPAEKAVDLAERLTAEIASARVPVTGTDFVSYTVSVGVACADPEKPATLATLSEIISRADSAAYQSKRAGKNRVSVASDAGHRASE